LLHAKNRYYYLLATPIKPNAHRFLFQLYFVEPLRDLLYEITQEKVSKNNLTSILCKWFFAVFRENMESTLLCRWIFRILAYKFSTMCQRKPILLCLYKCVCLCERPRFFTAKNQVVKSIKVRSSPRCHSRSIAVIIFKSKQGRNSSIKTLICMNHFERKKNTKKVYAYDCVCRYTYLRHKMASARRKI